MALDVPAPGVSSGAPRRYGVSVALTVDIVKGSLRRRSGVRAVSLGGGSVKRYHYRASGSWGVANSLAEVVTAGGVVYFVTG